MCGSQQHAVDEEELGGLGERAVVRILREGDDVAVADAAAATRNAFCASWSRASSQTSPDATSRSFVANTPTLRPLIELHGREDALPFDDRLNRAVRSRRRASARVSSFTRSTAPGVFSGRSRSGRIAFS